MPGIATELAERLSSNLVSTDMDTDTWAQDLQAYEYNTLTREFRDAKRTDAWTRLPGARSGGARPGDLFRELDDGASFSRAIERNSAPSSGLSSKGSTKVQGW